MASYPAAIFPNRQLQLGSVIMKYSCCCDRLLHIYISPLSRAGNYWTSSTSFNTSNCDKFLLLKLLPYIHVPFTLLPFLYFTPAAGTVAMAVHCIHDYTKRIHCRVRIVSIYTALEFLSTSFIHSLGLRVPNHFVRVRNQDLGIKSRHKQFSTILVTSRARSHFTFKVHQNVLAIAGLMLINCNLVQLRLHCVSKQPPSLNIPE